MPLPHEVRLPPPTSDAAFEDIVLDVLRVVDERPQLTKHGRRGQTQDGIDGYDQEDPSYVFQATLQRADVLAKLVRDLQKLDSTRSPTAREYVFAMGFDQDAPMQRSIVELSETRWSQGKCRIRALFWEKIASIVLEHPELQKKHYPNIGHPRVQSARGNQPATDRAWLVLENDQGVPANGARASAVYQPAEAPDSEPYFDLNLVVRNVGDRPAREVVIDLEMPPAVASIAVRSGDETHELPPSAPGVLFNPRESVYLQPLVADADRRRLVVRLPNVRAESSEPLVGLRLRMTLGQQGRAFATVRYKLHAAADSHTQGRMDLSLGVARARESGCIWDPRRSWFRNAHPDREDLRIRRGADVHVVGAADVLEIGARELDDFRNQHLARWIEQG